MPGYLVFHFYIKNYRSTVVTLIKMYFSHYFQKIVYGLNCLNMKNKTLKYYYKCCDYLKQINIGERKPYMLRN